VIIVLPAEFGKLVKQSDMLLLVRCRILNELVEGVALRGVEEYFLIKCSDIRSLVGKRWNSAL